MMRLPISDENLWKLIPQRAPIIMVTTLERYDDTKLLSTFLVKEGGMFVEQHHLAESGLLEHMAQSVALYTGYRYFLRDEEAPMGYIGSLQNVEIHRLPLIGETVFTEVNVMQEFMGVTLVEVETKLDEVLIARSRIKTVIAPQ